MDCSDIEKALLQGDRPSGPGLDAHLSGCESCRFLVGDGVPLAQALGHRDAAPAAPADLGLLEAQVLGDIDDDRGWLARLRQTPRAVRLVPLVVLIAAEALFMATYLRRGDWSTYPAVRLVIVAAVYATAAVALGWLALRPIYRRALPDFARNLIFGVALGLPFLLALLPALPTVVKIPTFSYPGFTFRCFAYGTALGLAIILVTRALDRGNHRLGWVAFAAAAAGGYAALLGLHLECPVNDPVHLLTGHATLPAGLAAGAWLFRRT